MIAPLKSDGEATPLNDQKDRELAVHVKWDSEMLQSLAEFLLQRVLRKQSERQEKLRPA